LAQVWFKAQAGFNLQACLCASPTRFQFAHRIFLTETQIHQPDVDILLEPLGCL